MYLIHGIFLEPHKTFSNEGESNHTWLIMWRWPSDSLVWTWALYWTKKHKECSLVKYVLQWCGFRLLTQDPIVSPGE